MAHLKDQVEKCLTYEERPSTPPEIRKYRRSTNLEPGNRFKHPGLVDDYATMSLDEKIYGITESNTVRIGASDLINHELPSELERINNAKAEKVYKQQNREPLGRIPDRGYQLPTKYTVGREAFGIKSSSSLEPAKNLIFPADREESQEGEDLYKRSHGSYGPGEQRRRGYEWTNVDPNQVRFGAKGDTIAFNGVSKNIADVLNGSANAQAIVVNTKKVEDYRNMTDILGQSKNLGQDSGLRPKDMVYGKRNAAKGLSAAEVLKGKYKDADNEPDLDLGKSITPGFRNFSFSDRVYGCPSIRDDIPRLEVNKRSIADSQNYGDDVPAQDLINPPAFSDLAIGPLSMNDMRPKEKVYELFNRIGYSLDMELADQIFAAVSPDGENCTINDFRDALNDFILREQLKK